MDANLLITLQNYGLSEKEARVYLTVLELGTSIASTIARRAELNRVTTYTILEEMIKKGTIISNVINNIKYYTSVHPETLCKNFENMYITIKESLPQLLEIMGRFSELKEKKEEIKKSERDPIVTKHLQKKFPNIYKKFFAKHAMVCSGTMVYTWGWWLWISGKFNVKQKLPTKAYVGVEYTKKPLEVVFDTIYEYDVLKDEFHEHKLHTDYKFIEVAKEISQFLKKNKSKKGIKFSVIMEATQWQGTGYTSIILTLVSVLLYSMIGKVKKWFEEKYDQFLKSKECKEILDYAIKLVHIITNKNAFGANSYMVLANTAKPVLYMQMNTEKKTYCAENIDMFLENKDAHIFNISPLDFGLIFLWWWYDSQMRINVRHNFENNIKKNKENIFSIFQKNKITNQELKDIFGDTYNLDFWEQFKNIFTILKLNIVLGFKDILEYPHDEEKIEEFIATINKYAQFSGIIETEPKIIQLIREKFEKYKTFNDEILAIFPMSAGKEGGSFWCVMKYKKSRNTLEKVFEILEKEGHKNVSLLYANRIDGYCDDGVKIEKI